MATQKTAKDAQAPRSPNEMVEMTPKFKEIESKNSTQEKEKNRVLRREAAKSSNYVSKRFSLN